MRVCGFLARILARIFQLGVRIWVRVLQKANCRTVHFHEIRQTCTPKIQPPFQTPKGASGRRLSAGWHANGSKISSWLVTVELDKVAGLGCSSVSVFCLPSLHPLLRTLGVPPLKHPTTANEIGKLTSRSKINSEIFCSGNDRRCVRLVLLMRLRPSILVKPKIRAHARIDTTASNTPPSQDCVN